MTEGEHAAAGLPGSQTLFETLVVRTPVGKSTQFQPKPYVRIKPSDFRFGACPGVKIVGVSSSSVTINSE